MQARPRLGELERAHDAATVVRVHDRGGRGVALSQERVGLLRRRPGRRGAPAARALAGGRWRRQLQLGQSGAQVETGAADDDRGAPAREDLVDRGVREALVVRDGAFFAEADDPDEPVSGTRTGS